MEPLPNGHLVAGGKANGHPVTISSPFSPHVVSTKGVLPGQMKKPRQDCSFGALQ